MIRNWIFGGFFLFSVLLVVGMPSTYVNALEAAPRPPADLMQSLERYKKALMSSDVEGILSFVYPTVFTVIPKDQLKAEMVRMYASGKAPVVKYIEFLEIGFLQTYGKGHFTIVKYALEMEMVRPADATPQVDQLITRMMMSQFGPGTKIRIDEKRGQVNIKRTSTLLAINASKAGWKVIEQDRMGLVEQANLLPKDIIAKLKQ